MYDVYLTCIDDDEQVLHQQQVEQDRNTWNVIQDQNWIFSFWTMNNEQWNAKETNENKSRTKKDEKNLNETQTTK